MPLSSTPNGLGPDWLFSTFPTKLVKNSLRISRSLLCGARPMKLSCRTQYAVRAMFDMAYHNPDAPSKIDAIAKRQGISARFLEQIFKDLRNADLITSKRGPKGGYSLKLEPEAISIQDIMTAVEGPLIDLMGLNILDDLPENADRPSVEITHAMWHDITDTLSTTLRQITLATLAERAAEKGVQRSGYKNFIYVI